MNENLCKKCGEDLTEFPELNICDECFDGEQDRKAGFYDYDLEARTNEERGLF